LNHLAEKDAKAPYVDGERVAMLHTQ